MPLTAFICPDNYVIDKKDCFKQCRYLQSNPFTGKIEPHRCLTFPTLKIIGQQREWNGVASTTQLLNGTMLEYLTLTRDFAVKPKSRMFALLGTTVHKSLDEQAKMLGLPSEVALSIDRDIFDLLEPGGWKCESCGYEENR